MNKDDKNNKLEKDIKILPNSSSVSNKKIPKKESNLHGLESAGMPGMIEEKLISKLKTKKEVTTDDK